MAKFLLGAPYEALEFARAAIQIDPTDLAGTLFLLKRIQKLE
jgi:hypothetical protein